MKINSGIRSAKSIVSKLDKRIDIEHIRSSLYSVLVIMLLSKEIFKRNIDIRVFLEEMNLHYRGYVYKSRTLLVARVIRNIEKANEDELHLYLDVCKKVLFPNTDKKINTPYKENNSVDELLRQFKRR